MKVLVVTENSHQGGLDTFIITLLNMCFVDDNVTLVCNSNHPGLPRIRDGLVREVEFIDHELPLPWSYERESFIRRLVLIPLRLLRRYYLSLRYFSYFHKLFGRLSPDKLFVVNGGYPSSLFCRVASFSWSVLRRKGVSIHNFHNSATGSHISNLPLDLLIDFVISRSNCRMVTVSGHCLDSLRARFFFSKSNRLQFIHNGVVPLRPTRSKAHTRRELKINSQVKIILMLATYEQRKGHAFLLEAFKRVIETTQEVMLVMAGYGYSNERDSVRDLVESLQLTRNVLLLDFYDEPQNLIQASSVVCVPSRESEAFGLTIVEAMSLRIPVIAARTGGIPEVLQHEEGGYLVDYGDVLSLSQCILRLVSDPIEAEIQGERGYYRYLSRFTVDHMISEYDKILY